MKEIFGKRIDEENSIKIEIGKEFKENMWIWGVNIIEMNEMKRIVNGSNVKIGEV